MCPMNHNKNVNCYNDNFRKMMVEFYHSSQKDKDLSSKYGVSDVTIYSWIKKFTPVELDDGSSITHRLEQNHKNKCENYKRKMKY